MLAFRAAVVVLSLVSFLVLAAPAEEKPKLTKEEQLLIDLTNEARAKEKLPAVKWNAVLQKVAAAHSANMIKQNKMEHELDGKRVMNRLDDANYDYDFCGENLGVMSDLKDGKKVFDKWMKSKAHHDNLVNGDFDEIGLAIVKHPKKDEWYITQVFGKENKK